MSKALTSIHYTAWLIMGEQNGPMNNTSIILFWRIFEKLKITEVNHLNKTGLKNNQKYFTNDLMVKTK